MPHKTVVLNEKVLEILKQVEGKSYSDKILNLHDTTANFLDIHFKIQIGILKFHYPDMAILLDKIGTFLTNVFHWKEDSIDEDEIEVRVAVAERAVDRIVLWIEGKRFV